MKKPSLSPRLVEHTFGLLALALLATGLLIYAFLEPQRIASAQLAQTQLDLDQAMTLYAQNCAVCHGLAGEGIGATPPLDNPNLVESDQESLAKIIARGLFDTAMPAWSKTDGGPLSDYEIDSLVTLIQHGNWQATQDRVVNLGFAPLIPFTTEPDPLMLEQVAALPSGEVLSEGIRVYATACVACHGADGAGSSIAPALNDALVREQSTDELDRIIRNGVAGTLMAGWDKALKDDELAAVVELITRWDEIPTGTIPAPDQPVPVTAESIELGAILFSQSCAGCHGPEGQGSQRAPALNVKSFLKDTNDIAIQQIITLGVPGTAMPAWGDRLTSSEIQAVVGFMRTWEATAPEVAVPTRVTGPWWKTIGAPPDAGNLPSGGLNPTPTPLPTEMTNLPENNAALEITPTATLPTGPANSGHGQGQQGSAGHAPGETNPWIQPELAWWQTLDWRSYVLLGSLVTISLGLIGLGLLGLRRLAI